MGITWGETTRTDQEQEARRRRVRRQMPITDVIGNGCVPCQLDRCINPEHRK